MVAVWVAFVEACIDVVGVGVSVRNTPGRRLRVVTVWRSAPLALGACDGGTEELSEVLGG
jgi:hypothetical protein